MENLVFAKMAGGGNDFIVIDNRDGTFGPYETPSIISSLCQRGLSIGADGLIFIENSSNSDIRMRYFNADGKPAPFCGNGARCTAKYAHLNGIAIGKSLSIECDDARYQSQIVDTGVRLELPPPTEFLLQQRLLLDHKEIIYHSIHVGVPHVVVTDEFLSEHDFVQDGRTLRNHSRFAPLGVNVNLLRVQEHSLFVRTYERGVERETLACGSGCVATALVAAALHKARSPVVCQTQGTAELVVEFKQEGDTFSDVSLTGDAQLIYRGRLDSESLRSRLSPHDQQGSTSDKRSIQQDP